MAKSTSKKVCRQYSVDYLKYGFIPSPHDERLPFCLLCKQSFTNEAMKPSRLISHLQRMHSDKQDKPIPFFKKLKDDFEGRNTITKMFTASKETYDDGVLASYNMSLLIAKNGKAHDIGERLILPCIREYMEIVLKKPAGTMKVSQHNLGLLSLKNHLL